MNRGDTPPTGYPVVPDAGERPGQEPGLRWWHRGRYAAAILGILLVLLGASVAALVLIATKESDQADRELAKARDQIRTERAQAREEMAADMSAAQEEIESLEEEATDARREIRRERKTLDRLRAEVGGLQQRIDDNTIPGEGTYVVGEDLEPGTYRAEASPGCYWARLRSLDTSDIIDNNNADGPVAIEVLPSDKALELAGCADFVKQE